MAGTTGTDNGPKAKARHEKIANERKEAQIKAKQKVEDDRWKVRFAEERRKEEIKKLPREERAEAKRQLKEQIVIGKPSRGSRSSPAGRKSRPEPRRRGRRPR
ncbi:MAG: hypothetical protein IJ469_06965 [Candidatus Methanomethylophilaceae archaeon]|nr:hypothetical protein [Candidatus Methanomethylophilaceae archaeon]